MLRNDELLEQIGYLQRANRFWKGLAFALASGPGNFGRCFTVFPGPKPATRSRSDDEGSSPAGSRRTTAGRGCRGKSETGSGKGKTDSRQAEGPAMK